MKYIKNPLPFERNFSHSAPAPRFRKKFNITRDVKSAKLMYSALGLGYLYINGELVSSDLFTSPVSDYTHTLWYNQYDVTHLIKNGDNVISAILGNGFYNESFQSLMHAENASWRDHPKLLVRLTVTYSDGGEEIIETSSDWKMSPESAVTFNMLRSGEYYDARLREDWKSVDFDDSSWLTPTEESVPESATLRKTECEPIREFEIYSPLKTEHMPDGSYLFKFPKTISGYVRIDTSSLPKDEKLIIRYAECIKENGELDLKRADSEKFYPEPDFRYAWDELTCDGTSLTWSPRFAYHGFRYIRIYGFSAPPAENTVKAVFIHQALEKKTEFICSDARLNALYECGNTSILSNTFYMPTDCPSREKLGWLCDAHYSCEAFLTNFTYEKLLYKWYRDILDAQREDGAIPAVVPTSGYGFNWGNGPVSTGALFEIPYRLYLHTGDISLLKSALPHLIKHLKHLKTHADENRLIAYGLPDWSGPWDAPDNSPTPVELTSTALYIKCLEITRLVTDEVEAEYQAMRKLFISTYFDKDGRMTCDEQCALALAIMLKLYPDREKISEQLVNAVEKADCHLTCGATGVRHLFRALSEIGRDDLAFRILITDTYPSYLYSLKAFDATTLLEQWDGDKSHNHQMYSDILPWMGSTLGGIKMKSPAFREVEISPYFAPEIDFCTYSQQTISGTIRVEWKRESGKISLKTSIPDGIFATFNEKKLSGEEIHII